MEWTIRLTVFPAYPVIDNICRGKDSKYKWSELAKELYIASERSFFRTPKQCRERWLNHLDPVKSKQ
jgi:hypothetical protein